MQELRFPYRSQAWKMGLAVLLFGGAAVFMGHEALTNDRGLVINRILPLGESEATGFYWIIAMVSAGMALVGAASLASAFGPPRELVLNATELSAPRAAWSGKVVTVPLAAIADLELQQVHSQVFLIIRYGGKKLTVAKSMLPSAADFDALVDALHARTRTTSQSA